jgi:hypothetical protein
MQGDRKIGMGPAMPARAGCIGLCHIWPMNLAHSLHLASVVGARLAGLLTLQQAIEWAVARGVLVRPEKIVWIKR